MRDQSINALIKRDTNIHHLDKLFDVENIKRLITPYAEELTPYYIRYKPGTSCLVQYCYKEKMQRNYFYVKAYSDEAKPEVLHNTSFDIQSFLFPEDGELTQIENIFDNKSAVYFFHTLDPMNENIHVWDKQILSYRPEKRLVVRLNSGSNAMVLKIFNKSLYRHATRNNNILVSNSEFSCPPLIAENEEFGVITSEWVPGTSMFDNISTSANLLRDSELVAKALASFHTQAKVGLKPYQIYSVLQDVDKILKELVALFPDQETRIDRLAGNIKYLVERIETRNCPCHGDFDANQVIIEGDKVSFIDFDRACSANPALDVGNYLAKLALWHICGRIDEEDKALLHNVFLSTYEKITSMSQRDIENYFLFCLFKCSTEPFRRQYARWPDLIEQILQKIESQISINSRKHRTQTETVDRNTIKHSQKVDKLQADEKLGYLLGLVDPSEASIALKELDNSAEISVNSVRIIKHRLNKRCLLEFNCNVSFADGFIENTSIMGKARSKGLDKRIFDLQKELWNKGFAEDSEDNISIPKPCGVLKNYNMWLYKKVIGHSLSNLLKDRNIGNKIKKVAEISIKLQNCDIKTDKVHGVKEELNILKNCLDKLITINPNLNEDVIELFSLCDSLAKELPSVELPIHRDYYPHQIVVSGERFYLIDLDLFAYGDPCLDIGNFIAHIKEQALREVGDIDGYIELEKIIENHYCDLSLESNCQRRIAIYTWLSMARHVYLSTKYPERQANVDYLLDLCLSRIKKLL